MPRKVVVFAGLGWSTGKVQREVLGRLHDCEVAYHDVQRYYPHLLDQDVNNCNIILSTLNLHGVLDNMFKSPELRRKVFLLCHGTPEIPGGVQYSADFRYGVTSDVITPIVHEKTNIRNPALMPNGVDFSLYTHVERSGELRTVGWAGAWWIPCKRFHMFQPIVNGVCLGVKATTGAQLPVDQMDGWYRDVDILLVMSGPEQWAETGPLTAFEAVACGIVVVGTRVGNSGFIPGPKFETVEEAVAIINDLKQNPEKVRELSKQQYEYVKANWSYDVIAPMWEEALFGDKHLDGDA